jgi:two-component system, OmpR family, sensor histidine kinase KdpD
MSVMAAIRSPPLLTGSSLGDRIEVRVIDRGAGIPPEQYQAVFLPFQRLGDTLTPEETPGAGSPW